MSVLPFPRRPDPDLGVLLSVRELASRWRLCTDTLYRMPARRLPYLRIGRRRLYRLDDVVSYEQSNFVKE